MTAPAPELHFADRGVIVPLYVYPSEPGSPGWAAWEAVAAAAGVDHSVRLIAVVNPANGPGSVADPNYRRGIDYLRATGVTVVGYVALGYGAVAPPAVARETRRWQRLYGGVQGIFFDEVPVPHADGHRFNAERGVMAVRPYLRSVVGDARKRSLAPLIGNPGISVPRDYFTSQMFDIVVVHENQRWPALAAIAPVVGSAATTRAQRSAALVYGDAVWDEARFIAFAERIGYLYVNDHSMYLTGQGRYPWNYLPTNLAYQVELVQRSKW